MDAFDSLPRLTFRQKIASKFIEYIILFRLLSRGGWKFKLFYLKLTFLLRWIPFERIQLYRLEKTINYFFRMIGSARRVDFLTPRSN